MNPSDLERMALGRGGKVVRVNLNLPPADDCSEEEFLQAVLRLFRSNGWLTYHTRDSRRSDAGFPDLVAGRGSKVIVAELKSASGKPTADQTDWLATFGLAGVPAYLWRPQHWANIVAVAEGG